MNYYEALNLLGVEECFDKITLKNAYRQKAKQYHPDTTSINDKSYAEEMMKKINVAYDMLLNHLKNKNSRYSNNYNNKENQSQNKINNSAHIAMRKKQLEKYLPIKYADLLNTPPFSSYFRSLKKVIDSFAATPPTLDIGGIDNFYMSYKRDIIKIIKDFIEVFCKQNNISNIPEINIPNLSFDEIYKKLLETKERQEILDNYFKEKCESLKKYMPQKDNEYYHDYYQEIIELISHFNNISLDSIENIVNEYNFAINSIKSFYLQLKIKFKLDFNIKESDLANLNYYCNIDEFYEQLLKIKNRYDIEISLKNKIEEETEKYKYYKEYNYAKVEIEEIKAKTYQRILNIQYLKEQDIEDQINQSIINIFNQMHDRINKAFAEAFDYLKNIEEWEKQVIDINNPEITEFFNYLKKCFCNGQSFMNLLLNLSRLEKMILINERIELLKQSIIEKFNIKKAENPNEINNYSKMLKCVLWYIQSLNRLCKITKIVELIDSNQIEIVIDLILLQMKVDKSYKRFAEESNETINYDYDYDENLLLKMYNIENILNKDYNNIKLTKKNNNKI